jgi:hypothetical protein
LRELITGAALAGLLSLCACRVPESDADLGPRGVEIRSRHLQTMRLGETTPEEVERRFGVPDERGPDGTLTYRWTIRERGGSVRFQFAGGALSKLCRERS